MSFEITSSLPEYFFEVAKEKYYHNTVNKLKNTQKSSKVYCLYQKFS